MKPMTRREQQRENTREEIKMLARRQMQTEGTAAISLRGIAREMGLTVTALYRYYASRDDLITALIVDGFHAQAEAMQEAIARCAQDDYAGQLLAAMQTYRTWALEHPVDFQLLYGNPIPGYVAPTEITVPAASRNFSVIVGALMGAHAAGLLKPPAEYSAVPSQIREQLAAVVPDVDPTITYIATVGWTRIHGMIMLELFDHTPPVVGDPTAFYLQEIEHLIRSLGLAV